jgi:hypothetical protein
MPTVARHTGGIMNKELRVVAWLIPAVAAVLSTYIAAHSWERVKTRPPDRTIQVTGSAKKRIVSDLIVWSATITTEDKDRTAAYRALHDHVAKALEFVKGHGVAEEQLRVSSVSTEQLVDTETVGSGEERIERQVFRGYRTTQTITVQATDVAKVERISREITQLLESGVPVISGAPEYFYTKLGELKIEMLAEASRDARTRADNIVGAAGGGSIGKLRAADMGVINVNPANSTGTSWEGNNDTTALEKDIITIVHVTYELQR